MLVREYLYQSGLTKEQLSEILGHKTTSMVTKKMEVEMPKRWARLLDSKDGSPAVGETEPEFDARAHNPTDEWEDIGREFDGDPKPSDTSSTVVGPQRIKLGTVDKYIRDIYGGAAWICDSRGDDIAADVIRRYTPEFSEAWIEYIKSDPRIMEWLERLMVGTPLGNLIGVHVVAVGSYVFARAAARQIAESLRQESAVNGSAAEYPGNPLA